MTPLAQQFISFYKQLQPPPLTNGFQVLQAEPDPEVERIREQFFQRFYADAAPRRLLLGINPGRFGAGTTGINFTGPRQLAQDCGIAHRLGNGTELSGEFVYQVVGAMGGAQAFYHQFFIGAVSPLGFVREGLNVNYYDDAALAKALAPQLAQWIRQQQAICGHPTSVAVLGQGKNMAYLQWLNSEYHLFNQMEALPHPRWIMQYRRKQATHFVQQYVEVLNRL